MTIPANDPDQSGPDASTAAAMRQMLPALGLLTLGTTVLSAGDLLPVHRKAKVSYCLPQHPYVRLNASNPVTAQSSVGLLLPAQIPPDVSNSDGTPLGASGDIRFWQMDVKELRQVHCSVSQVTFWIDYRTGRWNLSYRAEQNPFVGPDRQALPEARFLRNRFHVAVRGVGLVTARTDVDAAALAGPELLRVAPAGRWIERSKTEFVVESGVLDDESLKRTAFIQTLLIDFRYE